ncbi:MAG: S46 family peptidase [Blastocatellia bacterium]
MNQIISRRWKNTTAMLCSAALLLTTFVFPVTADEGMWTYFNLPTKQLKEKYGFEATQEWLDHLRLSSVRFNDGGSGSFISPSLIITNHHVASGQLQKISTPQKDYLKDGFLAKNHDQEIKCPDLELNVLVSMEDVTARVNGATKPEMKPEEAYVARQAAIAAIQKESAEKTGLRSDVVDFYQGSELWLYRYKKYTDVRIVFAPEKQAAFFGGDPDNFTYPRFDVDVTVMRVYENGKPINSQHYLKWNSNSAKENDLVFVSGHPGSTERNLTMAEIEQQRDILYPNILKFLKQQLTVLNDYAKLGAEQKRQAEEEIFSLENSQKAYIGQYQGLLDKNIMAKKQQAENELRAKVAANPEWKQAYGSAWDEIAQAQAEIGKLINQSFYRNIRRSKLLGLATQLTRYVREIKKPDAERATGFHEAELESTRLQLFSPAPTYPQLEERVIASNLEAAAQELGADDPWVKIVLDGKTPAAFAKAVMAGTKLSDPAFRKTLAEGGEEAVSKSDDTMLALVRKLQPLQRDVAMKLIPLQSRIEAADEKIGNARFAVYGRSQYPDANFTLRLSYGTVKGYPMNGTVAPSRTTFYGLYDRIHSFGNKEPFNTTPRFLERVGKLNLATPLNFVTTNDIIGGNSGSPVVNRNGEFVGIVFDGNIESLVGNFIYDETSNRTVAVHAAGIMEAMRKLYDANALADEIEGKMSRSAMK